MTRRSIPASAGFPFCKVFCLANLKEAIAILQKEGTAEIICRKKKNGNTLCKLKDVPKKGGTLHNVFIGKQKIRDVTAKVAKTDLWKTLWKLWITICKRTLCKNLCKPMENGWMLCIEGEKHRKTELFGE